MKKQTCSMFLAALAVVAIAVLYLPSLGFADVPQVLNYQGKLTNTDGTLVTNGLYKMVFNLYQNNTGGVVWTETWDSTSKVQVTNGLFNVLLGSINTATLGSVFQSNDNLYLGITVGTDSEMSPRQRVASVGYALRSAMDVPIGTILPWHKNAVSTALTLPSGWAECNGVEVSVPIHGPLDPDGDGKYTPPDLNASGRFLRGGSTSGTLQANQLQVHTHGYTFSWGDGWRHIADSAGGPGEYQKASVWVPTATDGGAGTVGAETRPLNMSAVLIIRIY
ncbi:MAG: hypothetical protein NTZ78_15355 [Candidatus Aureabacteria bacterium]|nr:hypothetical protein [Candidatus Auribacterota bacterium]